MKDLIIHFFTLPISKRTRIVLYVFQGIFSIVFASYLYKYFLGGYKFLGILDYQALFDYVISGRFFICLFFFTATWVLFYNIGYFVMLWLNKKLVEQITNLVIRWFKKKTKESNEDLEKSFTEELDKFLIKIDAIEFTESGGKIKGKKYKKYFSMTNHLMELSSEKRYLMPFLLLMMLFQFTLIYFNSFNDEINSMFLDVIIIIVFLIYLISFFLTVFVLETLVRLAIQIEKSLKVDE